MVKTMIHYTLQPVLMVAVVAIWYFYPNSPVVYPLLLVGVQVVLGVLEHMYPARRNWLQPWREKLQLIVLVVLLTIGTVIIAGIYDAVLREPLAEVRRTLSIDVWPHAAPLLVQILMVFVLSEFIWYWVHRAEHRWQSFWRISGHGAHHSFKHLGAINFGANHPFEMLWLVLPSTLVELTFGVGIAAAGAAVLTTTLASIAHCNLELNSRFIGWIFTTNKYHICHHSADMEESNTNYGCAAILWDRVFGTFLDVSIKEAGIGPTEPTLWAKWMMPFRDPSDSQVTPR